MGKTDNESLSLYLEMICESGCGDKRVLFIVSHEDLLKQHMSQHLKDEGSIALLCGSARAELPSSVN